jgi:hypothetical protein
MWPLLVGAGKIQGLQRVRDAFRGRNSFASDTLPGERVRDCRQWCLRKLHEAFPWLKFCMRVIRVRSLKQRVIIADERTQ